MKRLKGMTFLLVLAIISIVTGSLALLFLPVVLLTQQGILSAIDIIINVCALATAIMITLLLVRPSKIKLSWSIGLLWTMVGLSLVSFIEKFSSLGLTFLLIGIFSMLVTLLFYVYTPIYLNQVKSYLLGSKLNSKIKKADTTYFVILWVYLGLIVLSTIFSFVFGLILGIASI